MNKRKRLESILVGGVLVGLSASISGQAGSATFNFDSDPTAEGLLIAGNNPEPWKASGGNPSTGGYLSITDAVNSQYSTVIFPDFDNGLIVKAFTFTADVRLGNPTGNSGRPADGLSISYARATDAVIQTSGDINAFAVPGGPENGTATGIAIGFDTWSGNTLPDGPDTEGIIVRVDNVTVLRRDMLTRNGACNDVTSIQTGPYDGVDNETGLPDNLCWARVEVELTETGQLTVKYKGATLLDKFQTSFFPSAGRLVLAGRTGGANENNHVDNISITTVPADKALISGIFGNATSVRVTLDDVGASVVDQNTIEIKLNDAVITGTLSKTDKTTTFIYTTPAPLAPGSNNKVDVSFKDTRGVAVSGSTTFMVSPYILVTPEYAVAAGGVDKTKPGFRIRPYETEENQPNSLAWTEDQLLGLHGPNLADLSGADAEGFYDRDTVINFDIAGGIGNFGGDEQFPGLPGTGTRDNGTGNSAMEILTYLEFPTAGAYQMGVNSDDGFRVSIGKNPKDKLGVVLGQFDAGRGSADTLFDILVEAPGIYPFRLIWENGGGGANLEWFTVVAGRKILINNAEEPEAIKAYRVRTAPLPPYAEIVTPLPNAAGVIPIIGAAVVELVDGTTKVNQTSITATVDGAAVTPGVSSPSAGRTRVSIPLPASLPSGGRTTVTLSYQDNGTPATPLGGTWSFTTTVYRTVPVDAVSAVGSGDNTKPGFNVKTYQLANRANTMPNNLEWAEGILAGLLGENMADLTAFTGGVFAESETINYSQSVDEPAGNFAGERVHPGIPGSEGTADNYASEITTYVEFPTAGYYTMGVNSDDDFRVTVTEQLGRQFLEILAPDAVKGPMAAVPSVRNLNTALGGPLPVEPIEGDVVFVSTVTGCGAAGGIPEDLTGKIALIERGGCTFVEKGQTAQAKGAIAVIIGNQDANAGAFPIVMGGDTPSITIPIMMIDNADHNRLKALAGLRARIGRDNTFQLGEFDGNGRGASDTLFGFVIQQAGVYPLRCSYQEGGGGANIEWFTVEADGTKILLNDRSNAKALKAYRARTAAPPRPTISIAVSGANAVVTFTGVLQAADQVEGPYTDVAGATSPRSVPLTGSTMKFWRSRSQ